MQRIVYLCLGLSLIGVLLVYAFSPDSSYKQATIQQITANCAGSFVTNGTVVKQFVSKKGNPIVSLSNANKSILVLLRNTTYFVGDRIQVKGHTSWSSKTCWLFSDEVRLI